MKRLYYFFCFLVLLWQPFYVNGCERAFEDVMPLKDFVEALHELSIYDTVTFITRKKEDELSDGMSRKPLRDYKELQGDWNILWEMVKKLRSIEGSEKPLSTKDREKVSAREQEAFENEMFDELRRNETRDREEDIFIDETAE